MTYRDDEFAHAERARALIDEIAGLEREKLAHAVTEQRLEDARRQLASLSPPPPAALPHTPSAIAHAIAFCVAAVAAFAGYSLLF